MKTSSTYKLRSRPINRTGSPFGNGRGIAGPKALHLFRLEDQVNQSDRVRHGKLLQQKAYLFTTQLKKNGQDESPNHQDGKYIPSKGAEIHVYESPHGNKKIKGQLSVGQTTYLINSHHKALKALELLRQHREAKGFSEMESMLICWIEALNPSNETAPEESPVKKKHGDGDGEPGVNPSNTPSA